VGLRHPDRSEAESLDGAEHERNHERLTPMPIG
jgi:hypothetical protein